MNKKTHIAIGGANGQLISQLAKLSNRHGMIAGATGTGKTVTNTGRRIFTIGCASICSRYKR